ncbi:MaoC/PaaZ C-terminal domain-containing protein [uncultured Corynebacterium sp.]|uniref:MaoC/PaaZ C-terminal domain-containing protein n=1 Tax=uncultured Corynebacterium sp. TaxID=159447 RepID=UPI0025DD2412|nr:MaoC/PaaZ C-terminal domain-containing protein [uncultured Corynebacterium sp.]
MTQANQNVTYKQLPKIPVLMEEYRSAAKDLLPVVGAKRNVNSTPKTGYEVKGVKVDVAHLAGYTSATGLRLTNELPITYPYVLGFPLMMKVFGAKDFPVNAVGLVHLTNVIEQTRPLTVDDELDFRVHTASVRPHHKGVLLDMETTVSVAGEDVWKQTSTMLALGKKLKDAKEEPTNGYVLPQPGELEEPRPTATIRVTPSDIKEYAEASGDKNPIHVSSVGAKAFGFPKTIAHGMWTAAAMLRVLEGQLPKAGRFTVQFAKPVILPAKVAVFAEREGGAGTNVGNGGHGGAGSPNTNAAAGAWDLQVRSANKLDKIHAVGRYEAL